MKKYYKELIAKTIKNKKYSYSPYSKFCVSSSVLSDSGKIFSGVNIENSSFSLTLCAETAAIAIAISKGIKKITAVAIYADSKEFVYPCGACRQRIAEFSENADIILINAENKIKILKLKTLLPNSFKLNL
ncbi:MAG TPA: cytidine deaminase [Ignavibacteria bacterium]|nr:cytidine deaminase [Ignavibacteria bacterium]